MRAQFIRGQDPMDAMKLGDVRGRKLKNIAEILVKNFEKVFEDKNFKPKFEVKYKESNIGFENRDSWETDIINVITEYKGYFFSLNWFGNPLNMEVPQKFTAEWAKGERGAADMKNCQILNQAIYQLSEWMKNV